MPASCLVPFCQSKLGMPGMHFFSYDYETKNSCPSPSTETTERFSTQTTPIKQRESFLLKTISMPSISKEQMNIVGDNSYTSTTKDQQIILNHLFHQNQEKRWLVLDAKMVENQQTLKEIQDKKINEICRSCLSSTDLANIFEVYYKDTKMCYILENLFNIKISHEEELPKRICENCIQQVVQFYIFKKRFERSQNTLQMIMTKNKAFEVVEENRTGEDVVDVEESRTIEEIVEDNSVNLVLSDEDDNTVEDDLENKPFTFSDSEDEILRETYGIPKDLVIEFSDVDIAKQELVKEGFTLKKINFSGEPEILKCTCEETVLCIHHQEIKEEESLTVENKLPLVKKKFKCNICNKVVPWLRKSGHMSTHTKARYRVCPICARLFSSYSNLTRHLRIHSGVKPFVCEFCGKAFNQQTILKSHRRSHTGEKPYICEYCGKTFAVRQTLKTHQVMHINTSRYKCELCSKQFLHKQSLQLHERRSHRGEKPYSYSPKKEEPDTDSLVNDEKGYLCIVCDKEFTTKSILRTHMLIHGEKKFSCTHCDKKFFSKSGLQTHLRSHTGEKPFVCKVCYKRFTQHASLRSHSFLHSGQTPYVCKDCGKGFKQKHHLKYHMLCHSGKQPFACPYCPKRSRSRYYMESHVRLHTGERPFKCDVCSKAFTDNMTMKKHRKRMHKTEI